MAEPAQIIPPRRTISEILWSTARTFGCITGLAAAWGFCANDTVAPRWHESELPGRVLIGGRLVPHTADGREIPTLPRFQFENALINLRNRGELPDHTGLHFGTLLHVVPMLTTFADRQRHGAIYATAETLSIALGVDEKTIRRVRHWVADHGFGFLLSRLTEDERRMNGPDERPVTRYRSHVLQLFPLPLRLAGRLPEHERLEYLVRPAGLAVPIFGGIQNEAKSVPPPLPPVEPPPVPPARAAAPPAPPPRAPAQPPPRPALLSACALSDDERELAPVVERIANLIQLPLDVHGVAVLMAEYFVEGLAALELADEMEVLLRKERGGAIAAGHEYAPFTSARFGQLLEGCAFVKVRQWSEGGEKAVRARLARDADERRAALPPELAEADGDDELDEGGLTRRERALEEEGEAFRRLKRPEDVAEASAAPEQLAGDVPTPAAFLQGVRGLLSVLERDDPPARGPP